jgi:NADPH2:quinone reductase
VHAIRQYEPGPPEVLRYEDVPDPDPGEGQVRIAMAAAGVHLVDTSIRRGGSDGPLALPELPMTPGREMAGTVDAVGPSVDRSWIGQRVVAHLGAASGGYAELAVVSVDALHRLPADVTFLDGVAMVGTGRTAMAVADVAAIQADDVALVTAAAGGLGSLLVQVARRCAGTTVGLAGGPDKCRVVEQLGADHAVDYSSPEWPAGLRDWLGGRWATLGLDGVGGAIGRRVRELLEPGGRLVMFGYSSGEPLPLTAGDLFRTGITASAAVGARIMGRPDAMRSYADQALSELAAGHLRPLVHPPFALADAAAAHHALESRQTTGKVVLIP